MFDMDLRKSVIEQIGGLIIKEMLYCEMCELGHEQVRLATTCPVDRTPAAAVPGTRSERVSYTVDMMRSGWCPAIGLWAKCELHYFTVPSLGMSAYWELS